MNEKKPMKKGTIWRIIYPYLLIFGVSLLVSFGASVIFFINEIEAKGADFYSSLVVDKDALLQYMNSFLAYILERSNYVQVAFSVIAIPLALLFINLDKKRLYRDGDYVTYERPGALSLVATCVLGVFTAITLNNIISISGLVEYFYESFSTVSGIIYSGGIWLEILSIVILGPITEELIFRGLIYKRLREVSGPVLSIILSSFLFAYYHGNIVQGIYAFGMGALLAFVLERYQSIWACIAFHVSANALSLLLTESETVNELLKNGTFSIIYIVVGALGAIFSLWYVYEKIHPVVLIPSANQKNEEAYSEEE